MTTPKVQYAYASGSANHVRPTLLTYPSGRELNYNYGSADSLPDAASRLAALLDDDGSTHLADYSYLGRGMFVETDYAQPEVKYTLVGTAGGDDPDTGDIYRGLDRFSRIKDSYWRDYGSSADVDRIQYGYDRNGNRTYRENPVATANSASFDEKYFHDLLDRLKHMDRGRLNGPKDAVTNKTFAQCWSLDATGNWRKFTEDSNGDGVWDLDQLRTSNRVNEITDLSEYTGPSWVTPAYNRPGNMTTIPKPADPTASFTGTYDAWNRLVKLEDGSGTVAQYEYDGAKRRTVKKSYAGGTLTETRHFFYTEPSKWQVVEERVDSETDPDRQFVWGQRYIDDLVLRDRDTDSDGDLDERLFGMQDANWNVTGIVDSTGAVQERFSYSAYGQSTALTPAFENRGESSYSWERRFAGYGWDSASNLLYARNRIFAPRLAMWLQRDPMRQSAGSGLYTYIFSSPLTAADPFGLVTTFQCALAHTLCEDLSFAKWYRCVRTSQNAVARMVCNSIYVADLTYCDTVYAGCWATADGVIECIAIGTMTVGGIILIGTLVEDVLTGGIGVIDDPITIPAGAVLLVVGGIVYLVTDSCAECEGVTIA